MQTSKLWHYPFLDPNPQGADQGRPGVWGDREEVLLQVHLRGHSISSVKQREAVERSPAGSSIRSFPFLDDQEYQGAKPGDVVAAVLSNSPEYPILFRHLLLHAHPFSAE